VELCKVCLIVWTLRVCSDFNPVKMYFLRYHTVQGREWYMRRPQKLLPTDRSYDRCKTGEEHSFAKCVGVKEAGSTADKNQKAISIDSLWDLVNISARKTIDWRRETKEFWPLFPCIRGIVDPSRTNNCFSDRLTPIYCSTHLLIFEGMQYSQKLSVDSENGPICSAMDCQRMKLRNKLSDLGCWCAEVGIWLLKQTWV
jgi:hypothetical protein